MEQIIQKLQFLSETELNMVNKWIDQFNYDRFEKYLNSPSFTLSTIEEEEVDENYNEELEYEHDLEEFGFNSVNDIIEDMNEYDELNFFKKFNDHKNSIRVFNRKRNGHCCDNCGSFENHNCCVICKKNKWDCDCTFSCGIMKPSFERNGYGHVKKIHYEKCGSQNIQHTCKGYTQNNELLIMENNQLCRVIWWK